MKPCKDCPNRYPACQDTCKNPDHLKDVERAQKRREARSRQRVLDDISRKAYDRMKHSTRGRDGKLWWH